jgi:hypothetical protein
VRIALGWAGALLGRDLTTPQLSGGLPRTRDAADDVSEVRA